MAAYVPYSNSVVAHRAGFYLPFLVAHTAELQASAACSSGYPSGINNTPELNQQQHKCRLSWGANF